MLAILNSNSSSELNVFHLIFALFTNRCMNDSAKRFGKQKFILQNFYFVEIVGGETQTLSLYIKVLVYIFSIAQICVLSPKLSFCYCYLFLYLLILIGKKLCNKYADFYALNLLVLMGYNFIPAGFFEMILFTKY